MLLAIDTSTRVASVALHDGRQVAAELTWQSGMNHTVELFPAIQHVLTLARLGMADLTRLVVTTGPGSFNGIRVGMSAAKALSFSLNIPLMGISTLEAQAYQQAWCGKPICALLRAGREEVAAALFQQSDGGWRRLIAEHITTLPTLSGKIGADTVLTGEIDESLAAEIAALLGTKAALLPEAARLRRAGFLASLGWQRHETALSEGKTTNAATLQPLYLRRPPITLRQKP
ncbi:MAG: tRNA (adenosine(37)-N6)-threonylcarbamoyltransferase complex dimerization subunit type 1 TsaB [Chloroflexi bacterium]|nr:tRNA (adenosine(37)-N6)-threonylcarbamoyltransferase complex dimerization subunit type 1 TsaB [Chloroflexota bacterium]